MKAFSKLGEHGLLWQAIALTGAAADSPRRRQWLRAWGVIAGSFGANQVVKLLFRRPRPDIPELPRLMRTMSDRSYPSAHATTSAAATRVLPSLLAAPARRVAGPAAGAVVAPALTSVAVAMALSRLYLGVHWASDTVAGFVLGAAVAELAG